MRAKICTSSPPATKSCTAHSPFTRNWLAGKRPWTMRGIFPTYPPPLRSTCGASRRSLAQRLFWSRWARAALGRQKPTIGKYSIHVEEFEKVVLPIIDPAITAVDLYVIDEIGKMELLSR